MSELVDLTIICPVIIKIKFISMRFRYRLSLEAKRKLWLLLPYRLRLRIEHSAYVAKILIVHWKSLKVRFLPRLKYRVFLSLSRFYPVIIKLNNPYKPFTNAPVSNKEAEVRINNFLSRFTHA